jgi:hypothetical protein
MGCTAVTLRAHRLPSFYKACLSITLLMEIFT